MREGRHVDRVLDRQVVRREMEREVEVEVEVAIGFGVASLLSWQGSRRNAEVISVSMTTVLQSLEPRRSLHRGSLMCNKRIKPRA